MKAFAVILEEDLSFIDLAVLQAQIADCLRQIFFGLGFIGSVPIDHAVAIGQERIARFGETQPFLEGKQIHRLVHLVENARG